jgi:hypothetical protein
VCIWRPVEAWGRAGVSRFAASKVPCLPLLLGSECPEVGGGWGEEGWNCPTPSCLEAEVGPWVGKPVDWGTGTKIASACAGRGCLQVLLGDVSA